MNTAPAPALNATHLRILAAIRFAAHEDLDATRDALEDYYLALPKKSAERVLCDRAFSLMVNDDVVSGRPYPETLREIEALEADAAQIAFDD